MAQFIPSSFLPHLPRTTSTLSPLSPNEVLSHIAILRELYLPPIHGGFQPSDVTHHDEDEEEDPPSVVARGRDRERRFSAGLAETMDGLGLGLTVGSPSAAAFSQRPQLLSSVIAEDDEEAYDDFDEYGLGDGDEEEEDAEEEESTAHLDPFEKEWASMWLTGVIRRTQTYVEEHDPDELETEEERTEVKVMEGVLRDATAVLAMMAGTSAAGSLTRHLLFPIHPSLAPYLPSMKSALSAQPDLSPATTTFLRSLSTSPASPMILRSQNGRRLSAATATFSDLSTSPTSTLGTSLSPTRKLLRTAHKHRRRKAAIPILLHDAPMSDHLSVGVQTWGSAILLGRRMASRPGEFGLTQSYGDGGIRILELGAGTGLLSILCRKLLDLNLAKSASPSLDRSPATNGSGKEAGKGLVLATDFLPSVLSNLKICVDLNFPPPTVTSGTAPTTDRTGESGIHIAKLDWTTFPTWAERHHSGGTANGIGDTEESGQWMQEPFDLVLASDCVYDGTHAKMLREVGRWVLRPPNLDVAGDQGGTMHILSPLRPTFAPELESIDIQFPLLREYPPLPLRQDHSSNGERTPEELLGEGLGARQGLKLGVRGDGKRPVKGRKGEGRVDEVQGYWWWEIGWG